MPRGEAASMEAPRIFSPSAELGKLAGTANGEGVGEIVDWKKWFKSKSYCLGKVASWTERINKWIIHTGGGLCNKHLSRRDTAASNASP